MSSPQITLFSHASGPNGWKVAFILKALGLTYETKFIDGSKLEQKGPEFLKINPNGRIPAIIDHQKGDFALWESGAIISWLVENYDKEHQISVSDPKEKAELLQWLFFQASGQGPYFGQAMHFKAFAPEKIPYAITRYATEIERVTSVLDSVLAKSPSGYLVGGKLTVADLSFITWSNLGFGLGPEGVDLKAKYPAFAKWHESLMELPFVQEALKEKAALASH